MDYVVRLNRELEVKENSKYFVLHNIINYSKHTKVLIASQS